MRDTYEVKINGCSIFFEMEQLKMSHNTHDSSRGAKKMLDWSDNVLKQAAQPLVGAFEDFHQSVQSLSPDELELTMQLELALNGETPVFKVFSAGSKCQISAKFIWKKQFSL